MGKSLSVTQCRDLIPGGGSLTDDEITDLRDMLYTVAGVISDAFSDLENINPDLTGPDAFNPPGTLHEQWRRMATDEERAVDQAFAEFDEPWAAEGLE